jgi:hypothetical protein
MKSIAKAVFGYVTFIVTVNAGEESDCTVDSEGFLATGPLFYTKGSSNWYSVGTNEQGTTSAGWLNIENPPAAPLGTLHCSWPGDSEWVCIPYILNNGRQPKLASLVLPANETAMLPNGTNLYLVRGTLQINEKTFIGPTSIRVRSGDVTATSLGDTSYSLKFL